MRVYKVVFRPKNATINNERRIIWKGSGADAAKEYRVKVAECGKQNVEKPTHEDIPTGKPGLLAWLNENLIAVD